MDFHGYLNGNFRILKWRYLAYIRPIFQAYVRVYPHKIWPYMVQYRHFRILELPLKNHGFPWISYIHWPGQSVLVLCTDSTGFWRILGSGCG